MVGTSVRVRLLLNTCEIFKLQEEVSVGLSSHEVDRPLSCTMLNRPLPPPLPTSLHRAAGMYIDILTTKISMNRSLYCPVL